MKVAILNCSDIARRRMIPAFQSIPGIDIISICSRNIERAKEFSTEFQIPFYTDDPNELLRHQPDIVYISSPPSEHFESAKFFIERGVNVLCEKSLTTDAYMTNYLINLAEKKGVFIQENYAFPYHSQWKWIIENLKNIGEILYIQSSFEFPPRDTTTDFRYNPRLGGGALFDAGGYPIKLASLLMGGIQNINAVSHISKSLEVDLSGRTCIIDENGKTAFLTWSFESLYRCDLRIVGTEGTIVSNKIFTPKADEAVDVLITKNSGKKSYMFFRCDHFAELIRDFCIKIERKDKSIHKQILKQSNWQTYVSSTSIRTFTE